MTTDVLPEVESLGRAILPLKEINHDRLYEFWPWYLAPFSKPKVSEQCAAWVESGMTGKITDSQKRVWQRQLARFATIKSDTASALTRKPGAASTDREAYRRKGFILCQRVEGEIGQSDFPLNIWEPTLHGDQGRYYGCIEIVEELKKRLPWAVAQITARIAQTTLRMENRGISASQLDYAEDSLGKLNERLADLKADSIPDPNILLAFFLRFERVRKEVQQDAKYKEQLSRANAIQGLQEREQAALAAAAAGGA